MNKPPNPAVVKATVSARVQQAQSQARTDRDAVRRHQKALREIERWDVARETRPHTPRLAKEALDLDESPDVMKAIQALAGAGPRTATHPMATPVEPATRGPQPPLDFVPAPPLHTIARNVQPYLVLIGGALAFFAGLALGKAW